MLTWIAKKVASLTLFLHMWENWLSPPIPIHMDWLLMTARLLILRMSPDSIWYEVTRSHFKLLAELCIYLFSSETFHVFVGINLAAFYYVFETYKHGNHISDLRLNFSKTFFTDIIKTLPEMNIVMEGFYRVLDMYCLSSVHIYFRSQLTADTR